MRYIATLNDLKGPPWKDSSELALIRDWFYPQHAKQDAYSDPQPDMRRRAISKINLYVFKAGDIPHAMIATANLTEAVIHNDQPNRDDYLSPTAMASIYSMAVVKFVNGFVDRDVAKAASLSLATNKVEDHEDEGSGVTTPVVKGGGESSMYAYAAKIGMPEDFVDLRHEIVHGQIPELCHLREMTEKALEWLWEKWWIRNATGNPTRALQEIELRRTDAEDDLRQRESNAELVMSDG